jgi:Rps23 Pro-64 3,4-dihydroxylase Tpa1-like proline 4-hydroxylase
MPTLNDRSALRACYQAEGMVRIASFLPSDRAVTLHHELRESSDWVQLFNSGDKLFELDRAAQAALDAKRRLDLDAAIYAGARSGFQYRYETIRVPDDEDQRRASGDALARLALDLSSGELRDLFRDITGADDIRFADAQATAYSPGDFLTGHDDQFPGKDRRAAYVLSLTPAWRIEWGGLLVMHGDEEQGARAFPPLFNVLTLFRVPQMHSVSEVSRAAAYRRYSITGWLRA